MCQGRDGEPPEPEPDDTMTRTVTAKHRPDLLRRLRRIGLLAFLVGPRVLLGDVSHVAALAWNTFLGGSGSDEGRGIAVDGIVTPAIHRWR